MYPRLCLFCLCLVGTYFIYDLKAQTPSFERFTIEHGLSQGMIYDMAQTRDGFLWIATKDGLNRYDGYNFKVFSHDAFDPYSLAEDAATVLFEDSRGWLWVGLESKGVDIYRPETGRFQHFSLNFGTAKVRSTTDVFAICEAPNGNIYILQKNNGLMRISFPQAQFPDMPDVSAALKLDFVPIERFAADGNIQEEIIMSAVRPQSDGGAFVYTPQHVYWVASDMQQVVPMPEAGWGSIGMTVTDDCWGIQPFGIVHCRNGLATPQVLPVQEILWAFSKINKDGSSWIGFNQYLWHLSPGEVPDFSRPDWTVDRNISTALSDRNGNLWVGTQGYGLRKFNPRKQHFQSGATGVSIAGLWRDTKGKYYCKIVNKVYPYDPLSRTVGTQKAFPQGPDRVLDMWIRPNGDIWLLGRDDAENGLGTIQHYTPDGALAHSFSFPYKSYMYARLLVASDGICWATSLDCQLIRLEPQTGKTETFSYAQLFGDKSKGVRAMALAEDGNGTLWIGTQEGLIQFEPRAGAAFKLMRSDSSKPEGLRSNSILCLLPDPNDPKAGIWIGTKGGGINYLDFGSGKFRRIGIEDGLPDKVVYGILPGSKPGEFWCSTNRGLAKILLSPATAQGRVFITTFTAALGLQDNEFNTQAFSKATNGELLFGGVNGINRFFPDQMRPDTTPPPVYVVGLEINHKPVRLGQEGLLDKPLEYLQTLTLSYHQNNLSFEFAVLDFADPSKNRYRYQLKGLDKDWVETGNRRFAHYNHLAPGRYTFLVQGNNGEGAWQNAANPIIVVVRPPWWQSPLAYLVYLVLLVWAGWKAYRFQIQRVKEREQLAFEHREKERIQAVEQMKTNFFSNVTHEFRTPLTLIIEPLRRILPKVQDAEALENVRLAQKNSNQLLGLVNQLMDMAKIESGQMRLDLRQGDLERTVREIMGQFQPSAAQKGIALSLQTPAIAPFAFDAPKVETVLNNLLSNALKFTPEGGEVRLTIDDLRLTIGDAKGGEAPKSEIRNPKSEIEIRVSDTGIGIPPEALDRVFDRFYQVGDAQKRSGRGTGIGLALSKELAELMGGGITVKSALGQGTTFALLLPVVSALEAAGTWSQEGKGAHMDMIGGEVAPSAQASELAEEQGLGLALVVEDNDDLRRYMVQSLGANWSVAQAADGEEGLKKALELVPDIVVTDLMMPNKNGFELCDALKQNELTAHIPVVMLTAKTNAETKLTGLRRGADDYLTKPFNTDELLARMENLVGMRQRLRQLFGQQVATLAMSPDQGEAGASGEPSLLTAPDRDFLQRFLQILDDNISDDTLTVERVAQKMHVSRVQLHRKLKALTNNSATDFIRDYRLDRAYEKLKNREGMVYEVALSVGFGDEKYFSKVFKEKFGMSPSRV